MTAPVLRLGVVGLGRAFSLMLPTFLGDPRILLAGACDPRASAREQFAKDFNAVGHATLEELVADPNIDVVYIATPHQLHAQQTCIAARAGKHILVEKPMALSLEECDRMIAACEEHGVVLIVGHCHSFDAPYLLARSIIDSGSVGAVRMISAINHTDFLFRPRRAEELSTREGGGVVYSQAAHQVDVVRMLAGSRAVRVRCVLGKWDATRPTEGAYTALLWFEDGTFASLTYSGYAHFDSDEWCEWSGELGLPKSPEQYGGGRRRLKAIGSAEAEAQMKNEATYGGPAYLPPSVAVTETAKHQHFGAIIVSCEQADLRPLPSGVTVYGNEKREHATLAPPSVPRSEVIDELYDAIANGTAPTHDGRWAKATLEICIAMLDSGTNDCEIALVHQSVSPGHTPAAPRADA
ncbi:Gfo/Idh/MocA family protein [Glaciimonas sp. PCH181]|uniref:Gfo/Idh/MocA family protein n=1 Tax=Glaciimonas sp. PCH181 TaxID=2133943 RepID=UPI000D3924BA|nr:Gfo/Idh/MocA family oxidoreductase [Glaciimonas sp. PCH181]PUA19678.1 4,5-dihydroxyphthalate dehydrogenase [Glaciimonas sp. PCH181]